MNIFNKKSSRKKLFLILIVIFVFFYFSIPSPVLAIDIFRALIRIAIPPIGIIDWMTGEKVTGALLETAKPLAAAAGSAIIFVLFLLLNSIALAILVFSSGLFKLITHPHFIYFGEGYTTFTNNPVVNAGWMLIRDFTNMLFILALVVIALATILRYKDYAAKKALPALIAVALLINFTPLICGFIIDGANIIMNYFLKIGGNTLPTRYLDTFSSQLKMVQSGEWLKVEELGRRIGVAFFIVTFNFVAGLTILLFAFLFLARYVVLWLLIIISPLAFFAYIFPASRKYFHQWWHHFINWSIIGIIPAFLLFLANQLVLSMKEITLPGELSSFSTGFIMYLVPTALLLVGFHLGLRTSAIGADRITGIFRKGIATVRAKGVVALREKVRPFMEEKLKTRERAEKLLRSWQKVPVLRWAIPEKLRRYAETGAKIKEEQKRLSYQSSSTLATRVLYKDLRETAATAALREIIDRGDIGDLMDVAKERWKLKTDEEVIEDKRFKKIILPRLEEAFRGGELNHILRREPRLARLVAGEIGPYKGLTKKQAVEKVVDEARSQHISSWTPETLRDSMVIEAAMKRGREFWAAIDSRVKRGQQEALKTIDKMFSEFIDAKELPHETDKEISQAWEEFKKDFYKKHPDVIGRGYFKALEDRRFITRGWRAGNYLPIEEREKPFFEIVEEKAKETEEEVKKLLKKEKKRNHEEEKEFKKLNKK